VTNAVPLPAEPRGPRTLLGATLYGATIATIAGTILLTHFYRFDGHLIGVRRATTWQAAVYFTWAALVPLIARLAPSHAGDARGWKRRLTLGGLVMVPLHAAFSVWIGWLLMPWANGRPPFLGPGYSPHLAFVDRLPIDLLIYMGIVAALLAGTYAAEARRRGIAAAEAEALLARTRFDALSARLQPHFLFNALQAIATLIKRDPESATRMTVRLGDLLRASLDRSGGQEVAHSDELALLRAYLDIEAVRFADRLRVDYDIASDTTACLVPDLVLQPLVENAIKHGIAPLPHGGTIRISSKRDGDRLTLGVSDDGAGLRAGEDGPSHSLDISANAVGGVGLTVTRERLAHLYGSSASLTLAAGPRGVGTVATLTLPVRVSEPVTSA
jgi:ABC-type amino acid transport system permease subunit